MYLQITKTEARCIPSILSIGENLVVGVYRDLSSSTQKLYWRVNPRDRQILFSFDIDESGCLLAAELVLFRGIVSQRRTERPPSHLDSDGNVAFVSTREWSAPKEAERRLMTAWKYRDFDMPIELVLDNSALSVRLGNLIPVSTIHMDSNWSLGVGPNQELCGLFINGLDEQARAEILRSTGNDPSGTSRAIDS